MYCKKEYEIDLIRESSLLVAKTHAEIVSMIKPGVCTLDLDQRAPKRGEMETNQPINITSKEVESQNTPKDTGG